MEEYNDDPDAILRKEAEARLKDWNPPDGALTEDAQRLIHELRVHQIELEMQNEALRRTQFELEESRSQYSDLYDFAPVGYLTLDEHSLILQANLTAANLLGTERMHLGKRTLHAHVREQDKEKSRLHIATVFKTREPQTCEVRLRARSGKEFYARLESIFVEDKHGTGRCRTSVIDISRSKIAEQALKQAHDELEQRVADRTAALEKANELLRSEIAERERAERKLNIYADKLELSNRELQDFAFVASHDMQEPLRKIQTFTKMLKNKLSGKLDSGENEYMERIMRGAERMSEMIRGLLDYSRVGSRPDPFIATDLTRLVGEVLDDIEVLIEKSGASIEVQDLPTLEVDPIQMRQLFQNLIINALKFHGAEKPLVKIHAEPSCLNVVDCDDPDGKAYRIFVEDNGIGFEEQYVDRIFTLFQRLHGRSAYEGMGMGLAVCRRIVERHHGSITAKSTPGQGATFIITLPLAQPA